METDPRVTFCAELDHDKGYMRVWDDGGWTEYSGNQLTEAVRTVSRKARLTPQEREEIYKEKLAELAAAASGFDAGENSGMTMM